MSAEKNTAAAVAPKKRRRRWLRWLMILVGVAVVLRLLLGLLLPTIVDRIARSQGMTCSLGKFDLSLLGGSIELWDVELRPEAADAERLLHVEYATVDVDMSALLTATLRVHRVELDGVDVDVARAADGRWSWDTATGTETAAPAVAVAEPPDPNAPLDFGLPLEVRALRAQHLRLHVRDATTSPAFEAHLTLSARVSDLGSPQRAARLEVDAWSPECLDALRIEGEFTSGGASLLADLHTRVIGLRPGPLTEYLTALGVQPAAEALHFDLQAHAQLEATDESATACRGAVTLRGVQGRADGAEAFALDALDVPLTRVARQRIDVGAITVHGVRGNAARTPAGVLRVAGLELIGGATPPTAVATTTPTAAPTSPFAWTLASVHIDGVALTFADAAIEPATTTMLFGDEIALRAPRSVDGSLTIVLRAPDVFDRLTIEGTCAPLHASPKFDLQLAATGIAPRRLQPYLTAAGIESTFEDGALRAHLQGAFRSDDGHTLGDASLTDLELRDGDTRLATASCSLQGLDVDAHGVRAARIAVRAAALPVRSAAGGAWQALGLRVPDAGAPAELGLEVSELTLEVDDLALTDTATAPIVLRAKVVVADAIEALTANGTVTRGADNTMTAALQLHGTGLTLTALKPLLLDAGLVPEWAAAEFTAKVEAQIAAAGTGVQVRDLKFTDAAQELLALELASVAGLTTTDGALRIGAIDVRGPTIAAARDAQGGLMVAGIRLQPVATVAPAPTPTATAAPAPSATAAQIDTLNVTALALRWRDDAVEPAVATTMTINASGERLAFGAGVAPAPIDIELRVTDSVESLALRGEVRADPDDLRATLELTGNGLRAGGLASYLPPDVRATLVSGRLHATIAAQRTRLAAGGHDTRLEVSAIEFADGDAALLSIDRLALTAPRLDAENGVFEIDELAITGIAASVARPDADTIAALGLAFKASTASAPAPAAPAPDALDAVAAEPAPTTPPPTVTLRKLDIDVTDLTWHDAASGAAPVHAGLRLTNAQPWRLLDADPEALPPLELSIVGQAAPAFTELRATLRAAPFAVDPHASVDLRVSGIDAEGIVQAAPALRQRLTAGDLRDGVLQAKLDIGLHVRRRQPTDLGLARPFGADLSLTGLELRDAGGNVLAGLEALNIEASKIAPATGDVHIKTLEVVRPAGIVRKLPDGLHALGFVVPPASAAPATEDPAPAAPIAVSGPTEAAASKSASDTPAPEFRIDELAITGLDFRYEDATVEPPFAAPLEALDVEVRGFTTRAFTEARPVRFRASLSSGKVAVPERQYASMLSGLLGAAAKAIGGGSDEVKLEQRRFFDEISTSGRLSFYPALEGRVRTSINSLELLAFRQLAEQAGVTIGDGVLDAGVDLQFKDTGGLAADTRFVFQYLSVDEPADGPISRYLRLPAPLDTVLFVLRNDAGEQNIPLDLSIGKDGVGGGQIATAAATALGSMITDAIASSPFRLAGALTDFTGITGGVEAARDDMVSLEFAPFETALSARASAELDATVSRMLEDDTVFVIVQHELGGGDIARGTRVANPDPQQTMALVQRLQARQAELRRQREQRAADARVQLALGDPEPYRAARTALEAVERESGENELSLDTALALLRPGAERRADKRAKQTCVAMASDRLETVRRAIVALGGADLAARIEIRKPRFVPVTGDEGGRVLLTPKVRTQ